LAEISAVRRLIACIARSAAPVSPRLCILQRRNAQRLSGPLHHTSCGLPPPFHGGGKGQAFSRRRCVRALPPPRQCQESKTLAQERRGERSAERRIQPMSAAQGRVGRQPAFGAERATECIACAMLPLGARSPSGAPPRLSSGLRPPDSASGHASWDVRATGVTRALATPVKGQHLPPRS
jgi:hypothetical protein